MLIFLILLEINISDRRGRFPLRRSSEALGELFHPLYTQIRDQGKFKFKVMRPQVDSQAFISVSLYLGTAAV